MKKIFRVIILFVFIISVTARVEAQNSEKKIERLRAKIQKQDSLKHKPSKKNTSHPKISKHQS